jgi:hypothetical protein
MQRVPDAEERKGFGEYSLILALLVAVAIMALLFTGDGLGTLLGDLSHSL